MGYCMAVKRLWLSPCRVVLYAEPNIPTLRGYRANGRFGTRAHSSTASTKMKINFNRYLVPLAIRKIFLEVCTFMNEAGHGFVSEHGFTGCGKTRMWTLLKGRTFRCAVGSSSILSSRAGFSRRGICF